MRRVYIFLTLIISCSPFYKESDVVLPSHVAYREFILDTILRVTTKLTTLLHNWSSLVNVSEQSHTGSVHRIWVTSSLCESSNILHLWVPKGARAVQYHHAFAYTTIIARRDCVLFRQSCTDMSETTTSIITARLTYTCVTYELSSLAFMLIYEESVSSV